MQYLQLRHCLLTQSIIPGATRPLTPFEKRIRSFNGSRGLISRTYQVLQHAPRPTLHTYQCQWQSSSPDEITSKQWEQLTNCLQTAYKVMTQWYYTPHRLHPMFPTSSPTCWRCTSTIGDFLHVWWHCSLLATYWKGILSHIKKVMGYRIPETPTLTVLGLKPTTLSAMMHADWRPISHMLGAAKQTIAVYWKKAETLPVTLWFTLWHTMEMELLTARLTLRKTQFVSTWQPLVDYFCLLEHTAT